MNDREIWVKVNKNSKEKLHVLFSELLPRKRKAKPDSPRDPTDEEMEQVMVMQQDPNAKELVKRIKTMKSLTEIEQYVQSANLQTFNQLFNNDIFWLYFGNEQYRFSMMRRVPTKYTSTSMPWKSRYQFVIERVIPWMKEYQISEDISRINEYQGALPYKEKYLLEDTKMDNIERLYVQKNGLWYLKSELETPPHTPLFFAFTSYVSLDQVLPPYKTMLKRPQLDIMEFLLLCGADPDKSDNPTENLFMNPLLRLTLVDYTFYQPRYDAIQLLIDYGADIEIRDKITNNTPLLNAMTNRYADRLGLIKLLVNNGADVNVKNNQNNTPLHLALGDINSTMLDASLYLAKKGANPNITNKKGKNVWDLLTPILDETVSGQQKQFIDETYDRLEVIYTELQARSDFCQEVVNVSDKKKKELGYEPGEPVYEDPILNDPIAKRDLIKLEGRCFDRNILLQSIKENPVNPFNRKPISPYQMHALGLKYEPEEEESEEESDEESEESYLESYLRENSREERWNLDNINIGDEGARVIGEALAQNRSLVYLRLARKEIGDEGAKAIGEALSQNRSLSILNFRRNQIRDEGAKAIGQALTQNRSLTKLDLGNNRIGDEGAKAIGQGLAQNQSLTYLNLERNNIGDEGVKAIGQALSQNQSLEVLDFDWNSIGPEGGKAIGHALAQNHSLTKLDLRYNRIFSEGAKAIGQALAQNQSLKKLDLHGNNIGPEGGKTIGEGLGQNRSLTYLDLSVGSIGSEGAKAIGEGLAQNHSLTYLNLYSNMISDETKNLLRRLARERRIDIIV